MIVVSDTIALSRIRSAAKTGTSKVMNSEAWRDVCGRRGPTVRPRTTYIATGMTTEPIAPNGSRRKIFVSSHVNCNKPRMLIPNRPSGEFQKDVLEGRMDRAEVGHPDAGFRQALDHRRHEGLSAALDRHTIV